MLKTSDVDGSLLGSVKVAATDTEVRRGADHAAGESQRIVGENCARGSIVVLQRSDDKKCRCSVFVPHAKVKL